MMKKILLSALVFIGWAFGLGAQQLTDSGYRESLIGEPVEIIHDKISVEMIGVKIPLMRFAVKREMVLVIRNRQGITELNSMLIPEYFDQVTVSHAPSNYCSVKAYDVARVDSVAAWRIRHRSEEKITAKKRLQSVKTINYENLQGELNFYRLTIPDASVGDTLRVYYSAAVPFNENWQNLLSIRVFHHAKWPRKNYQLTWHYQSRIDVDTVFFISRPVISQSNGLTSFHWSLNNLPGALDEANGRPHTELPWFIFNPKPAELLQMQYTTFDEEYIPSWMIMSSRRERDITLARINVHQGVRTTDLLKFNKIVDSIQQRFPHDTSGFNTLGWFQKVMVEKVKYDMDKRYYSNEENYLLSKPGSDLASHLLRDRNRVVVYSNILLRMGFNLLSTYPADKRVGSVSPFYFPSIATDDFLFLTILRDSSLVWIYPRSDKAFYYADEMPFYFENTDVMLTIFSQQRGYKRNMSTEAMFYHTPTSKTADNFRKVNSIVDVNLIEQKASFSSRVSLSGQFSTLTRHIYRGLPADSTVNSLYHKKVNAISPQANVLTTKVGSTSDKYPFLTSVTTNYETSLPAWHHDTLSIDLTGWFLHITVPEATTGKRFTSFFPDFTSTDTWSYMIRLDQPVEVAPDIEPVKISNDYGQYSFEIKQLSPKELLITSYYLVKSPVVAPENINQVQQIFESITSTKGHLLKLVKKAE